MTRNVLRSILPAAVLLAAAPSPAAPDPRPNVVVILADDLGYADLGCQGSAEVKSPHIDSIASNGVRFTAGYVSAPQCCPSRAGLVTGRYQNRFGFEANWPASAAGRAGLPADEATFGDRFKAAGYVTGMIGKWHLGDPGPMRPYNRGFDETLWHPNGGVLFPDPKTGCLRNVCRGPEPAGEREYSTDAFGREACAFIGRHAREPFLLYLAFVPPHWPMEAKPERLAQYAHVTDLHRRTMLAMMASLDENVGRVLAKLREEGLEERTLVFFLSDNGGPTGRARPQPDADFEYGQNTSKNDPFRGVKGELLEGGIRIPFMAQWKGRLPAGRTYDRPVISLDILPTALAAAGVTANPAWKLDGVDLLPFLSGARDGDPHDALFWRFRFPATQPARHRWAIRQGDWKLVKNDTAPLALHDLAADPGETNNLAAAQPDRARAMEAAWRRWNSELKAPLWGEESVARPSAAAPAARHAKITVMPTEIRMQCTGPDPQAVFGGIPAARGPYTLRLRMKSASTGAGEVFWSTGAVPEFAAGRSARFQPSHDPDRWEELSVSLSVTSAVTHLRLDPGTGPGLVRIADMALEDAEGNAVRVWIGKESRR